MRKEKTERLNEEKIILRENELLRFYWNELKETTPYNIAYADNKDDIKVCYAPNTDTVSYYVLNGVCLFNVAFQIEVKKSEQR